MHRRMRLFLGACRCLVENERNRQVSQKSKTLEQSQKQLARIIMRGAHDDGSHGSKCLMGLRPGKRRDCGNGAESWEWAWAIAGTTCRSVKRHTSCLAMANAPATTMSAEKTRRRVLLRSLPGFWIQSRRISGLIRRPAAPRPAEAVAFPWRLLSERCDSEISLANHGIWAAWCRLVMGLDPDVRRCRNMVHSVK